MKHGLKYFFSATTKRTSMLGGNQDGWVTDEINAPPFFV